MTLPYYRRSYQTHIYPFEEKGVRFERKSLLAVVDMASSYRHTA